MAKNKQYKILFDADPVKSEISVKFTPYIRDKSDSDVQLYLNVLLSGLTVAMSRLLRDLPLLRPATKEELDAKIYIFKYEEKDNRLYNVRKQLHRELSNTFSSALTNLFPDVEYINDTLVNQQELVMAMTPEQAAQHKKDIEDLAKSIKEAYIADKKE